MLRRAKLKRVMSTNGHSAAAGVRQPFYGGLCVLGNTRRAVCMAQRSVERFGRKPPVSPALLTRRKELSVVMSHLETF